MAYEKYRATKIESGRIFQDFVVDAAWNLLGLAIVQYTSEAYQRTVGESRTGAEIKHDEQFAKTGNLWIELAEKARPRSGPYMRSGIYRQDNTWLYCIGDYDTIFFFAKTLLRALHASGRWRVQENNTRTSEGFLLKAFDAEKYAAVVLRPNAAGAIRKVVGDLGALGRLLHEAAKRDINQLDLFRAQQMLDIELRHD
jgi:hypothetical protein